MMFGLISGMVKDPSMNDQLEATRLAIIRLEESLHTDQRIDPSSSNDQFQRFSENQNAYQDQDQHQDPNRDEEHDEIEDEEMEEVEDEDEDEELEETEETEIESDLSRDSRSI
ncbi:uncharacterized protein MELLADRAFT_74455 [Melampsora larici-populina 98AG31]|uniref:Uncharacterized protein n=1 Tax=Melampsora larici-populina (strain 98AG31 / pathotype 3-4-7) TaxID=747676 RepID=F4RFG6_MELLP|nr:uncharacterized protein MELLADRAFT_74455 [Melampsora larici-populina 98AG31]EGG08933.1 hypothetical protein MELLADRAFT_74455 [Melampsora larici-populina 98AG31]